MRKHEVKCQIEGNEECNKDKMQEEINSVYVKTVENILRKLNFSRDEKIYIINQIQERIINL